MRKQPAATPPRPGEGKRGVDGHLAYLLRQANASVRLTLERSLAELDVTLPQFLVLTMLKAYPGLSGADLARVALLTPQTVGLITRNLERLDAIAKQPHPTHGRVLQFTLTPKGSGLLAACRKRADSTEGRLAVGLAPGEEAVVRRWLVGLVTALGTDAAEAATGASHLDQPAGGDTVAPQGRA